MSRWPKKVKTMSLNENVDHSLALNDTFKFYVSLFQNLYRRHYVHEVFLDNF